MIREVHKRMRKRFLIMSVIEPRVPVPCAYWSKGPLDTAYKEVILLSLPCILLPKIFKMLVSPTLD